MVDKSTQKFRRSPIPSGGLEIILVAKFAISDEKRRYLAHLSDLIQRDYKVNEEDIDQVNGQENEDDIGLLDDDQADEDDIITLENDEADTKIQFRITQGLSQLFFPFVRFCTRFLFFKKPRSGPTSRSFLNFLLFLLLMKTREQNNLF